MYTFIFVLSDVNLTTYIVLLYNSICNKLKYFHIVYILNIHIVQMQHV
jgi:hypothetical protein